MADVRVTPRPWLWVPRAKPIRMIEVHATRGRNTPAQQFGAALNWVKSPENNNGGWGASFSYVIGTDGSMGTVLDDNQMPTYSAGYGGPGSTYAIDEYGISYELAQSAAQEPFTDACLRRAAREIAAKCNRYGIPAVFLAIPNQSGTVPQGLVRHDRCQNGYVLGKTDPGDQFNESGFLALMRAEADLEGDDMTDEQLATILAAITAHDASMQERRDEILAAITAHDVIMQGRRDQIIAAINAIESGSGGRGASPAEVLAMAKKALKEGSG